MLQQVKLSFANGRNEQKETGTPSWDYQKLKNSNDACYAIKGSKDIKPTVSESTCRVLDHHHLDRPSNGVRKKMENCAEIFGIIMRKKVTIMRKRCQIIRKFLKLTKLFPWLFQTYKIHVNVLPRI